MEFIPLALLDATWPITCTSEIFMVFRNRCVARGDYMVLEVDKIWPQGRHGV